jgi:BMFP domain-containing protein YqiC
MPSDNKTLDELVRRLSEGLPEGLRRAQGDAKRNLEATLQSALRRLDLVTREEFEVQAALLARSQERVRALEARIRDLEERENVGSIEK